MNFVDFTLTLAARFPYELAEHSHGDLETHYSFLQVRCTYRVHLLDLAAVWR